MEDDEEDTDGNNGDNGDENDHCIYLETLKILSTEHSQTESEMSTYTVNAKAYNNLSVM